MTARLLVAHNRREVINALSDARVRHTLIGCWISAEPERISWVSYLSELGDITRLTYYPDTP